MHKTYYASGFLYHVNSQQIFLQQITSASLPQWSLVGKESHNTEQEPLELFRDALTEQLHITVPRDAIYSVYNYTDETSNMLHYIFYAEVEEKISLEKEGYTREWFTLKQISKLPLSAQTKHDIIVADRVIKAKARMLDETPRFT